MFHFKHQITLLCLFNFAVVPIFAQRPKILCLHGGGGTGAGFSGEVRDLENALPQYEFVYADGGYRVGNSGNRLWISDPPGGKGQPTTDPAFSDESIAALDALRESEGPFAGILGYSQGAAYVPVYLSRVPENTFDFAVMFCGYPTETHQGILEVVEEQSPFGGVSSLIWIGEQDSVIPPSLSRGLIDFFDSPTVISSPQGGHFVPWSSEPTFPSVVSFIASNGEDSSSILPPLDDTTNDNTPVDDSGKDKEQDWGDKEDYDWGDKEDYDWGDKEDPDVIENADEFSSSQVKDLLPSMAVSAGLLALFHLV